MRCPRDGFTLVNVGADSRFGHRCSRCDGSLFDEKGLLGAAHGVDLAQSAGLESFRNLPDGGCACPRDGAPMRLLQYRGVEIDVCIACRSVWLDAGEHAKVRAIVRREQRELGLDRAASFKDGAHAGGSDVGVEDAIDVVGFIGEALGSIFDGISF